MKKPIVSLGMVALAVGVAGCSRPQPVTMSPPIQPAMQAPMSQPAPVQGSAGVFNWQDVPQGQQVPINRAVFDQGGYQLYAGSGETIVIPFANQNMYVMKFGKSGNGSMYFVNEGSAPTLYVPNGGYLENAAAQGARWFPFSNNFAYSRPVYMGLAPTWGDYVAMGWYPGMVYYGGYWGYNPWRPGLMFSPMVGLNINIGGRPYYGWNSYRNYYNYNTTGRVNWSNSRSSFNYASAGRRAPGTGSFGSSRSSTGSFGSRPSGTGSFGSRPSGSGSFGSSRNNFGTATNRPSFGSSGSSTGSFGSGRSTSGGPGSGTSSFGSRPSGSSFGGSSSGFGSSTRSRGSFGSGSSGFSGGSSGSSSFGSGSGSSFGRSSGGSFGGGSSFGRSSGSSFGRSSGGFGGGRSSFGGGRRR